MMSANAVIYRMDVGGGWDYAMRLADVDAGTFTLFVAELKATVPASRRKWDAEHKRWLLCDDRTLRDVMHLLHLYGLTFEEQDAQDAGHRGASGGGHEDIEADAYATLWLRPGAPSYVVEAVYRAMSKRTHPDAGGTHDEMIRINSAAERLRHDRTGGAER